MPLVSGLLAVHNEAGYVRSAVCSILRQTVGDLELIVVDDSSSDGTSQVLADVHDPRMRVVRNDARLGLAASLNRGLEHAEGRYIARLDADDVALPQRFALQLARMREQPLAILGTGVLELDGRGRVGPAHVLPAATIDLRWHTLFSSPFFHPTVLIDRENLDQHRLRYDPAYLESEDYDLWARLIAFGEGSNLTQPLVLRRVHPGQASARRADLQRSFQREIALREIGSVASNLTPEDAERAWLLGTGSSIPATELEASSEAYLSLLRSFESVNGRHRSVRRIAARALSSAGLAGESLRLAPEHQAHAASARVRSGWAARFGRRQAQAWLPELDRGSERTRVTVVSPEPTPYRSPLFDRLAARPDLDLTVIYAAESVAARTWSFEFEHDGVLLRGINLPGARRIIRHDYPVTPGVVAELRVSRPDVVVISGWSTFAAQVAMAWCRVRRIPYVLVVESHDLEPRSGWRQTVKGAIVPRLVHGAASLLVVGSAARDSLLSYGAEPERVRIFANTVDVAAWEERAGRLTPARSDEDVVVLAVGRLIEDKGLDVLIRAIAAAGDQRLRLVLAGAGPERNSLRALAAQLGVDLTLLGDLSEDELAAQYVAADVFALLSRHEPWGVVVNEAAASGLPLVLSTSVGAAHDLLREGENGYLVPPDDIVATAAALHKLAEDSAHRRAMGARSRELVRAWGYEPSLTNFVAAVREATSR